MTETGRPLLAPSGDTYPAGTVDPEDIRVDPWTGNYFWSQEGERLPPVLLDASLANNATVKPMSKRLLVDLADVGLPTMDNVEGITWGPVLSTGERTLLLVSDNNFASSQVTQVIALAVR